MDKSELPQQDHASDACTQSEVEQKRVQFYSASVTAWFNSALEYDKSLLTLSTAGVGLLITLLTEVKTSDLSLFFYSFALLFFLTCIFCALTILNKNKERIERQLSDASYESDPQLRRLDSIAYWAFVLGVMFSAVIGIESAFSLRQTEKNDMTDKKTSNSVPGIGMDSFDNMAKLQPSTPKRPAVPAPVPPQTSSDSQNSGVQQTSNSQQKDTGR